MRDYIDNTFLPRTIDQWNCLPGYTQQFSNFLKTIRLFSCRCIRQNNIFIWHNGWARSSVIKLKRILILSCTMSRGLVFWYKCLQFQAKPFIHTSNYTLSLIPSTEPCSRLSRNFGNGQPRSQEMQWIRLWNLVFHCVGNRIFSLFDFKSLTL